MTKAKPATGPHKMLKMLAAAAILCLLSSPGFTGSLYICAEHIDPDDWQDEWARGPVVIPAGAVFDLAGHIFGSVQDPKDNAHSDGPSGWKISAAENERRSKLILEDSSADQRHKSGVATRQQATLTRTKPCAEVPATAVLSPSWGWTIAKINGNDGLYYQLYGVIRGGELNTSFDNDAKPLDHLAARGQINAVVRGTINEAIRLLEGEGR